MKRKDIKVYVREKKGFYYAVVVYKNALDKRKEKWFPTKLPIRGNKKKAEAMADQILAGFEIPAEDMPYPPEYSNSGRSSAAHLL